MGPQIGVSQNNTLNLFGGGLSAGECGVVGCGGAGVSEAICDGEVEWKGNTNAIRSLDGCNINVCP